MRAQGTQLQRIATQTSQQLLLLSFLTFDLCETHPAQFAELSGLEKRHR